MKEIWKRLTNESPSFFKKIIRLGVALGIIGAAIMTAPEAGVALPEFLQKLGSHFTLVGFVAAAIAKTTVSDISVLDKKEEPKI